MDDLHSTINYMASTPTGDAMKSLDVKLSDFSAAAHANVSFKQFINGKCPDASPAYGCAFDQAVQAMGAGNKVHGTSFGTMSPTLAQVNCGMVAGPAMGGVITAPDGTNTTPAGRIFMPEIILDIMRDTLTRDNSDVEGGFNSMIAVTDNIAGAMYVQPKINVSDNENVQSQSIAQGTDPAVLVNISASQVTKQIPTESIGLQINDQALSYATIDLVGTILGAHSRGQRIRMVENDIKSVIYGDTDAKIAALPATTLQSYDAAITAAGEVTHKAFLKMLHEDYQSASIDSAIMSIDTYLKFEGRAGKPTADTDAGKDSRLNTNIRPVNFSLSDLNVLIIPDSIVGANTALFMDSRYALRKVVDTTATYEAIQAFVMRRMSQLRIDFGQKVDRLYDDASKLITLTV